jgi:hypothetical protein
MSNMKKTDIVIRSANPNCWTHGVPALNVKWWPYLPDIVKKFKATTGTSKYLCVHCDKPRCSHGKGTGHHWKPGGTYTLHDFGDDETFWQWVEGMENEPNSHDYPHGVFTIAEEIAREGGWEQAKEDAYEVWGSDQVKVWSSGRSGGWLTVEGLGDVEDWDAIDVSRWCRYAGLVQDVLDDLDYQFVWHLHVNVWEHWLDQFTNQPTKGAA